MRGAPLSTTGRAATTGPSHPREVPSIIATNSAPKPVASDRILLRQVWTARPLDWQDGDPAMAAALTAVRHHLIATGDIIA